MPRPNKANPDAVGGVDSHPGADPLLLGPPALLPLPSPTLPTPITNSLCLGPPAPPSTMGATATAVAEHATAGSGAGMPLRAPSWATLPSTVGATTVAATEDTPARSDTEAALRALSVPSPPSMPRATVAAATEVVNHGVGSDVTSGMLDVARCLFELPLRSGHGTLPRSPTPVAAGCHCCASMTSDPRPAPR